MKRLGLVAMVMVVLGFSAETANASEPMLLVIPARYTLVQFAFDVARMRSVYLVSYEVAKNGELDVYVWDKLRQAWQPTSEDAIVSQSIFDRSPSRAVIVGRSGNVPAAISESVGTIGDVRSITSLNLADVVNELHQSLKFKPSEWRWLAGRYGLELQDRNADRRRWGRYGPPGEQRERPMPTMSDSDGISPVTMPERERDIDAPRMPTSYPAPAAVTEAPQPTALRNALPKNAGRVMPVGTYAREALMEEKGVPASPTAMVAEDSPAVNQFNPSIDAPSQPTDIEPDIPSASMEMEIDLDPDEK